jgi:hypothetical protein
LSGRDRPELVGFNIDTGVLPVPASVSELTVRMDGDLLK